MPQAGQHGDRRNLETVGERVNINQADREALRMIDGLGEARADQIVAWRERHGRFETVDDLQRLPLIGPALLRRIRDRLTV